STRGRTTGLGSSWLPRDRTKPPTLAVSTVTSPDFFRLSRRDGNRRVGSDLPARSHQCAGGTSNCDDSGQDRLRGRLRPGPCLRGSSGFGRSSAVPESFAFAVSVPEPVAVSVSVPEPVAFAVSVPEPVAVSVSVPEPVAV